MSVYRIFQTPGDVVIQMEKIHDTRVIPLDGRPHVSPAIRRYLGDSRGHFDGDTLVVETTNFHPAGNHMGGYFRYADENLRLTERFTRVRRHAALRVHRGATPPSGRGRGRRRSTGRKAAGPIYEYACHEGNYSLRGMLVGLARRGSCRRRGEVSGTQVCAGSCSPARRPGILARALTTRILARPPTDHRPHR